MTPGLMAVNVVEFNLTLAGSIESFNSTDYRSRLAAVLLVIPVSDISSQVYAASVIVVARIWTMNATMSAYAVAALQFLVRLTLSLPRTQTRPTQIQTRTQTRTQARTQALALVLVPASTLTCRWPLPMRRPPSGSR